MQGFSNLVEILGDNQYKMILPECRGIEVTQKSKSWNLHLEEIRHELSRGRNDSIW